MPPPSVPQHAPTPRELDDLELLVTGAYAPTVAFDEPGSPVTLELPPAVAEQAAAAGAVELVDPEGLPLARVALPGGTIEPLTHAQYGPFRRHYLTPAETRTRYAGRTFVPLVEALGRRQLDALATAGPLVLLPLVGHGTPELSPVGLVRATLAAAAHLPDAAVVAVPLPAHGDADVDHALGVRVTANYAGPDPVLGVVDDPAGDYPPEIAAIVDFELPAPDQQGLVVFFTGLSGSGKSTLARALMDRLLERGTRTVTSLDGDVVRRNLSAGLTFSKEDRETNIRRIGWVAAEISRHGGVAVCSPIAPFDATRKQVRATVDQAGGAFFLVHVATPLEECERRDRKGLYAKARRGEIPEFTGISSPYEEPQDADVRVDTTGRTIDDALDDVLRALRDSGHLDLLSAPGPSAIEPDETPLRVLFVGTANVCRSPFMELAARHLAGPGAAAEFSSAGTHGRPDAGLCPDMAAALAARDIPGGDRFRSRPVSAELLERADLVLTAATADRQLLLDRHPAASGKVLTLGQLEEAVRRSGAELSGRDLLQAVGEHGAPPDPALDVADPGGQGPRVAEACAASIEGLLRVVLPALTGSRRIPA